VVQDRLAFVREDVTTGASQIFTSLFNGTDVQALSAPVLDVGGGPITILDRMDWSPDGIRLAFVGQDGQTNQALFLINRDGTGLTQLTTPGANSSDRGPVFSPDGQTVLFLRDSGCSLDIWRIDISGANETRISDEQICDFNSGDLGYDWSPDGTQIVFNGFEQGFTGNLLVWVMPATTTAATYFADRRIAGRGADAPGLVWDIQPTWRP
jgi:dipeptidyl aminopeptidase/acylaminoacyl peptidase